MRTYSITDRADERSKRGISGGIFERQIIVCLRLIRERLAELGVHQTRWAQAACIHPSTLSSILHSKRTNLRLTTIDALLDAAWVCSRHQVAMRPHLSLHGEGGDDEIRG